MALPVVPGEELLAWVEQTGEGWQALLAKQPEILQLPCDIAKAQTVAALLQHIVAVELRYAERLHGLAATPYDAVPMDSATALYATHERAMKMLRALGEHDAAWWDGQISFATRSAGEKSALRRTVFAHALLHSIRHYAQLATLVRQHGVAPGWPMDFLFLQSVR
ncbi:MAG: DinB family protein [Terriglobales bacterium]